MPPKKTVWKLDQHSEAKHYLLRRYLQAWLPIMSARQDRLVLIDGFAGPGVYEDGQPGSPIIMLQAFLEHNARDRIGAELVYVLIEKDPNRAGTLEGEIGKLGKLPPNLKVQVIAASYEDACSGVLEAGASPRTINRDLNVLSLILGAAQRRGKIGSNPIGLVVRPRERRPRWTILKPSDVARVELAFRELIAASENEERSWREQARVIFLLVVDTGIRRGEALHRRERRRVP